MGLRPGLNGMHPFPLKSLNALFMEEWWTSRIRAASREAAVS